MRHRTATAPLCSPADAASPSTMQMCDMAESYPALLRQMMEEKKKLKEQVASLQGELQRAQSDIEKLRKFNEALQEIITNSMFKQLVI